MSHSAALIFHSQPQKEQKAITPHAYADVLSKGPFKDELRQELSTKGYYVVKGAIPEERALQYRQRAFQWLENFGLGFDRNDESTWIAEKLPPMFKGGMLSSRVYHEQWVWDVRSEQGVVDAFAKVSLPLPLLIDLGKSC